MTRAQMQPKLRIPLPGIPETCPVCGTAAEDWTLGVYGHSLNVTCPECFSIVAPVVAVRSAGQP